MIGRPRHWIALKKDKIDNSVAPTKHQSTLWQIAGTARVERVSSRRSTKVRIEDSEPHYTGIDSDAYDNCTKRVRLPD